MNDLLDRQVVFQRKAKIPFVVCRHGHHRAIAVAHQHIIADPNRHGFAGQRMVDFQSCVHAFLFHCRHVGFGDPAELAFLDESGECRIVLRRKGRQRVFRRDGDKSHAHDGIGAGGIDPK